MPLSPAEFAATLVKEAHETHPWLHHPLFRMAYDGGVPRSALDFYHEHMEVEEDHADRAIRILEKVAATGEAQKRGLLAMRRAITARRICAGGMLEASVLDGGR